MQTLAGASEAANSPPKVSPAVVRGSSISLRQGSPGSSMADLKAKVDSDRKALEELQMKQRIVEEEEDAASEKATEAAKQQ